MSRPSSENWRILSLLTDAFGGIGGIARFNRNTLAALCSDPRVSEVVALTRVMPLPPEPLPEKLTYRMDSLGGKGRYVGSTVRQVLSGRRFDLVVCGLINLVPLAYMASKVWRAPDVCILHGIDAWTCPPGYLTSNLIRSTRHFVAVSEITRERFISWSNLEPSRITVIPNTVALDQFRPGARDKSLMNRYSLVGKRVLLTVGRMQSEERNKGFDEVLGVLPTLLGEKPDLVYLIVGDGNDRSRLEHVVREKKLEQHVRFAGFVPESEKAAHYRLADAYVMPSRGEGFGIVFLEAMACGIPVVASNLDGGREAVLGGKIGVLVNPNDRADVIRGIEEALERPNGHVPPELSQFSYPMFEQKWHRLLGSLVAGEPSQ